MMKNTLLTLIFACLMTQAFAQGSSCTDATRITADGNYPGTTAGFSQEFWYLIPSANGMVTFTISSVNNCGIVVDISEYLTAQTGDCVPSNSNRIVSNVTTSCNGQVSMITLPVTAGNYYYIQVAAFFVAEAYTLNINSNVPLPVSLVDQQVSEQDGKALIQWTTSAEQDNSHFSIQRSRDGVNFTEVGQIAGNASVKATSNYEFQDKTPFRKGYYRIVQYDFDGQSETFPVMYLKLENRLNDLKLYNRGGQIVLEYQAERTANHQLQLINTAGQVVYQERLAIEKGENNLILEETTYLPHGVYFARLQTTDDAVQTSFFK